MEWWLTLIIIGGLLMAFFFSGMPVAFAFMALNLLGFYIWADGFDSWRLLVINAFSQTAEFGWTAVPAFVLMGEVLFHTGLASLLIDNVGKWVGRIRGSLSLSGVAAGTLFAMMSGSSVSGVAVFGSTLGPEMRRRGYKTEMIYGPILGAGGLAILIPPSIMTVILATLTLQSVGDLLIASIVPGFILAGIYVAYILIRCQLQPHLAPVLAVGRVTWAERARSLAVMLPLVTIILVVLGLIFFGVATPTEAASLGATAAFVLAAAYRKLTWRGVEKALKSTIMVSTMTFAIIMSSSSFSQLLAYTGVARELGQVAVSLPVSPTIIILIMMVVLIAMGMFIDSLSMVMITIPIFYPIIKALGISPVWFGIFLLVNQEMATISPPFGILLFTLKGVLRDVTMGQIYRAAVPICLLILFLLALLIIFPQLATWLPSVGKTVAG
ncbi:MAG: TRAP transporter large permease subunit [Chloroflexi bacterium]|nr:TRAP transporter large permease subunit [Chloroflexota bacterium]